VAGDPAQRTDGVAAPPVVAVVVVHDVGPWFDETLRSLANQDYPALSTFFILADGVDDDIDAQIRSVLPEAFVERYGGNPGFGAAANVVAQFVEGDSGFFCFCHDDVALDTDAVRLMVEELYRSNAGIVGPKLVDWDHPRTLQDVGLDVDRFGEPASRVEPGEIDQEQHDAVTDVFAVPSACFLVRADLFRSLGGFDSAMSYHGEDVDLCWRAHIGGARVVVAPGARVRHREQLEMRRPDLNHAALRARHALRSTLTLTAGSRLPIRLLELVGLTLVELVVGVFTGHAKEAWASLRALVGAVPRFPTLLARRGTIAKIREVSDTEVHGLQTHGSNRLASFRRARETQLLIGVDDHDAHGGAATSLIRRWRERSPAPLITWLAVIVAVLIASRSFINRSVPTIGEFLPFPDSPRQLWSDFVTGWNSRELGATSPNPTGLGLLAAGSFLWLFHMGLGLTMLVVGAILLGALGVWRLADLFPSNRERIVAMAVYVAIPLLPGVISTGRLTGLIAYGALPWFVHLVRVAAGIGTADPRTAMTDLADGVLAVGPRERVRRIAVAGIVAAIAVALAPPVLLLFAAVTVVLTISSLLVGAAWRTTAWMFAAGAAATAVSWILNLPASTAWSWNDLTAIPLAGAPGRGLSDVASMNIGRARLSLLTLALYVPVVTGLVLSRAWRLSWAGRAAGLVVTFGVLAVLQDRDALPLRVPEIGVLLVPVALGVALAAACAVASFASDVAGGTFGWRQPLGVVSLVAVLVGSFPALVTLTDGAWYAPRTTMMSMLAPRIAADDFGDFRVLYVGDPRVLPGAPHDAGGGIAYTLTGPGVPQIDDRWAPSGTDGDDEFAAALNDVAGGATQRGGRLLAPYAVRYVVVPHFDGGQSTPGDPIDPPLGLTDAFGAQLDLRRLFTSPAYDVFENTAAFPGAASFAGELTAATTVDGPAELVRQDLSGAPAVLAGVLESRSATGQVPSGAVTLAVPFDDHWLMDVAETEVAPRVAFGALTGFDVAAGAAELRYETSSSRYLELLGQAGLWLVALVAASRFGVRRWTARRAERADRAAVIDFADDVELPTDTGEVPVMVPLEPVGAGAGAASGVRRTSRPLFRADDETDRAAWVEEMFADEEEI
jgi:GT2 family glycosyltransferase